MTPTLWELLNKMQNILLMEQMCQLKCYLINSLTQKSGDSDIKKAGYKIAYKSLLWQHKQSSLGPWRYCKQILQNMKSGFTFLVGIRVIVLNFLVLFSPSLIYLIYCFHCIQIYVMWADNDEAYPASSRSIILMIDIIRLHWSNTGILSIYEICSPFMSRKYYILCIVAILQFFLHSILSKSKHQNIVCFF